MRIRIRYNQVYAFRSRYVTLCTDPFVYAVRVPMVSHVIVLLLVLSSLNLFHISRFSVQLNTKLAYYLQCNALVYECKAAATHLLCICNDLWTFFKRENSAQYTSNNNPNWKDDTTFLFINPKTFQTLTLAGACWRPFGSGQFVENDKNEIAFREVPSNILERVCTYLYYRVRYTNSSQEIPEFVIPSEIALELLMAANFLDSWLAA